MEDARRRRRPLSPGQAAESDGTINRCWMFRFAKAKPKPARREGAQIERQMGLGSFQTISLAEAREKALKCRKLRDQGIDPIEARRADQANAALEAARVMTFDQCRDAFVGAKQAGWRNVKHASQWRNTLTTYVSPVFGKVSVGAIDTALVTKVLQPLWTQSPRLQGESEVGSRQSSIGRRHAVIGTARTLLGFGATSSIS